MSTDTTEVEELETKYARFQRAAETGKRGSYAWRRLADETLEELIAVREKEVEELARQHNGIEGVDHIAVGQQNDIRKEYQYAVSELSALREKAEDNQ